MLPNPSFSIYFLQKCIDREDKVYRGNNQVINLTTKYIWSGCVEKDVVGAKYLVCDGKKIGIFILLINYLSGTCRKMILRHVLSNNKCLINSLPMLLRLYQMSLSIKCPQSNRCPKNRKIEQKHLILYSVFYLIYKSLWIASCSVSSSQ